MVPCDTGVRELSGAYVSEVSNGALAGATVDINGGMWMG